MSGLSRPVCETCWPSAASGCSGRRPPPSGLPLIPWRTKPRTSGWSATTICRAANRCSCRRSDAANGNWVYVGHHENFYGKTRAQPDYREDGMERHVDPRHPDPANPKLVWHIPNETDMNSRSVSVVYDYKFDASGRDYLIRNSEADRAKPRISSIRSSTSRRGTRTHRRSHWCRRSPERRRTRAAGVAAARSSFARTKAGGRRRPDTSTRPRASRVSAT